MDRFDNAPAGRQSQLQAEAAGQLGEEGIQRADAQAVQVLDQLSQ